MPLKHLARLLTVLAMLVAQFGMLGGHAMAEMPRAEASAASGHCAEMAGHRDQAPSQKAPEADVDCRIACSCIPAAGAETPVRVLLAHNPTLAPTIAGAIGPRPAADPPPPRLS